MTGGDWEREDREKQKGGRRVEGVICVSVEEGLAALSWGSGSSLMVAHISSCLNIISEDEMQDIIGRFCVEPRMVFNSYL